MLPEARLIVERVMIAYVIEIVELIVQAAWLHEPRAVVAVKRVRHL